MSDVSHQASDQGRFAAREFLARWIRETGDTLSPTAVDRLLFTYEMGYLRGRSDAAGDHARACSEIAEAMKMFDDVARSRE